MRLILAVVGGVMALLCLGGIGVTFVLYDEATKIDRGTPVRAVDSFLIAYLVNRSDDNAKLFTCDEPNLSQVKALRDEIVQREKDHNVKVAVSWGVLTRSPVGSGEELVQTDLTISGSSNGEMRSRRNESWEFRVVDRDGWRVCAASKLV
jgi:hypothetical protein